MYIIINRCLQNHILRHSEYPNCVFKIHYFHECVGLYTLQIAETDVDNPVYMLEKETTYRYLIRRFGHISISIFPILINDAFNI